MKLEEYVKAHRERQEKARTECEEVLKTSSAELVVYIAEMLRNDFRSGKSKISVYSSPFRAGDRKDLIIEASKCEHPYTVRFNSGDNDIYEVIIQIPDREGMYLFGEEGRALRKSMIDIARGEIK